MIEKNINTDIFDELLTEQSNDALSSVSSHPFTVCKEEPVLTGMDGFDFIPYRSGKVVYEIPNVTSENFCCKADYDLTVCLDEESSSIVSGHKSFYLRESLLGKKLTFFLQNADTCGFDEDKQILFTLYKEGIPKPIAMIVRKSCFCDEEFTVKCDSSSFSYGNYFVLVAGVQATTEFNTSMGGNMRFDFRLLQHGEEMVHPHVTNAILSLSSRFRMKNIEISGRTTLDVKFDVPGCKTDEYIFHCMTDDYMPMCPPVVYDFDEKRKHGIRLSFNSEYIWMNGKYYIMALHNGEPFYKAMFVCDVSGFRLSEENYITCGSSDYFFAKYLMSGGKSEKWNELAMLPGLTRCKRMLHDRIKSRLMNDWRNECGLRNIYSRCNYCLTFSDEKFLSLFVPLATDYNFYKTGDCFQLSGEKNSACSCEELDDFILSCRNRVMVLKNISVLLTSSGKMLLNKVENWLDESESHTLFLCGTDTEVRQLTECSPVLKNSFPPEHIIEKEPFTLMELIHAMQNVFKAYDFMLSRNSEANFISFMRRVREKGIDRQMDVEKIFLSLIYPRIKERIMGNVEFVSRHSKRILTFIEPDDLDIHFDKENVSPFETAMKELNEMVGLEKLKQHINRTFDKIGFDVRRRNAGLAVPAQSAHHMIFTGNPGTGKTTVAKKMGKIFHSLGILSCGDVIHVERAQLVGRYIGETEHNMQQILQSARGNVLFIDEAYTLCDNPDDKKDFGNHVIESLLSVMARPNPDMVVIFAGYEKEMRRMMQMNQGLEGRFPHRFHFDDYSEEELMQIALNLFEKYDYILASDALSALHDGISDVCRKKNERFSNARWVEQLVSDGILSAMSSRVMASVHASACNREILTLVQRSDVEQALDKYGCHSEPVVKSRYIGFC